MASVTNFSRQVARGAPATKKPKAKQNDATGQQLHAQQHRHQQLRFQTGGLHEDETDQGTGELRIGLVHREQKEHHTRGTPPSGPQLGGNDVLTVNGGDYWVCSLELGGTSQLIMGASAQVRFFFDTPEHCGLSAGATQLTISGNNRISSSNKAVYPGLLFPWPVDVSLDGNSGTDELVIYGPETTINITGSATYKGVMAGKKIIVTGNGHIEDDSAYKPPTEITPVTEMKPNRKYIRRHVTARYYSPQFYVECTGTAASGAAPNASC